MPNFIFLASFFLVEKKGPQKRERRENNDLYSGHLRLVPAAKAAHGTLSDKLQLPTLLYLPQIVISPWRGGGGFYQ